MTLGRDRRTGVWLLAAAALAGFGVLYGSPLLAAATVIPLSFVAYASMSRISPAPTIRLERRIEPSAASLGEHVEVSLHVENTGTSTLADLRVVDGLPEELPVVDGDPRAAVSLRPGESGSVEYTVIAQRDEVLFDEPLVRLRSLGAGQILTTSVTAGGDDRLTLVPPRENFPGRADSLRNVGNSATDAGGGGLEFHSTREYRPGDPQNRIHWRQFAKTGELTTVDYLEERSVRTVVIVDVRPPGRVPGPASQPPPAARCGYAAERLYRFLQRAGVETDLTALGIDDAATAVPSEHADIPWVPGSAEEERATRLFDEIRDVTDPWKPSASGGDGGGRITAQPDGGNAARGTEPLGAGAPNDPGREQRTASTDSGERESGAVDVHALTSNLPNPCQVVFLTPLLDDDAVRVARSIAGEGYPLTVIAPAVPDPDTLGWSVAELERGVRRRRLAEHDVETISWTIGDSFDVVLTESLFRIGGGHRA